VSARAVLSESDISRSITRIAHEILETNHGLENLVLLGIPTRGATIANRIATAITKTEPSFDSAASLGQIDITMYRDDLGHQIAKVPAETKVPVAGIDGMNVVLVDDVLFSGRTVRAALDALNDLGRPRSVKLAVLVDRGHRELPIRADFVGKNLPTSLQERIFVRLRETDGDESVVIE